MGTAMAITALPVIARILMDMNIYRTRVGMLIMAAAMFDDLVGWLIFSVVLAMMQHRGVGVDIWLTLGYILAFGLLMLTAGRKLLNRHCLLSRQNFHGREACSHFPWDCVSYVQLLLSPSVYMRSLGHSLMVLRLGTVCT